MIAGVARGIGFEARKRFLLQDAPTALGDIDEDQAWKRSQKARRKFDQGYEGRKAANFNCECNGYYLYRLWAVSTTGQ